MFRFNLFYLQNNTSSWLWSEPPNICSTKLSLLSSIFSIAALKVVNRASNNSQISSCLFLYPKSWSRPGALDTKNGILALGDLTGNNKEPIGSPTHGPAPRSSDSPALATYGAPFQTKPHKKKKRKANLKLGGKMERR